MKASIIEISTKSQNEYRNLVSAIVRYNGEIFAVRVSSYQHVEDFNGNCKYTVMIPSGETFRYISEFVKPSKTRDRAIFQALNGATYNI